MKKLIKNADIIFNANSLSEMGRETVEEYIDLINSVKPEYFLHQNSNFLLFPNSERHLEILASEFPIDEKIFKKIYQAISMWQGAGGRYREYLYKKI